MPKQANTWITVIIVLGVLWFADQCLRGCGRVVSDIATSSIKVEQAGTPSDTDSAPSSYVATEQHGEKVKVVDWTWADRGSAGTGEMYAVSGKVKNMTSEPLRWVDLEMLCYDRKGAVCAGESTLYAQNVPAFGTAAIQGYALVYSGKPKTASLRVSAVR